MDTAVIAALAIWRPRPDAEPGRTSWVRDALCIAFGAGAIIAMVSGIFLIISDDPASALARLRGESISVEPSVSDVGDGVLGETREFQIQLRNNTDNTIRVVGGTANCDCVTIADLPIELAPHEVRLVAIEVRFKGSAGVFQRPFVLFTDDDAHRTVTASVRGHVSGAPEG